MTVEYVLLEALRSLKENGPANPRTGICSNVHDHVVYGTVPVSHVEHEMERLFAAWPKGTKGHKWPIPSTKNG